MHVLPVSSFGLSSFFPHLPRHPATCDGVYSTEPDHYVGHVAGLGRGNGHANCIHDAVVSATGPDHYACYGVSATEPDHYACYAADRGHSSLGSNLVVFLILRSGHATEQVSKSGGTLATTWSIHESAEKSHIVVKDECHCRRALLPASYAIVRSGSNGKQGWQP